MGSVSPLVAVYEECKKDDQKSEFLFLGTAFGPEKVAVESYRMPFQVISSGKWRRYFDWQNLTDLFRLAKGFFQSVGHIMKFKPDVVFIAGAFVGVPVAYAAWMMRVPVIIHQQDIIPGLANKLMAKVAAKVTVSFEISLKDFDPRKTVLTGNPVRREFHSCDVVRSKEFFDLVDDLPTVLMMGGGTGAATLNGIMQKAVPELVKFCQVIHITGRGKHNDFEATNYHQFEFLTTEMSDAICAADLVVNRAGLSTLSELIVMAKPTILVPMPDSHQEFNAQYFQKHNAVVNLSQKSLTSELLVSQIHDLLQNDGKRESLSSAISGMMGRDGAGEVVKLLRGIVGNKVKTVNKV